MSDAVTGIIRIIHVLSSVTWIGGFFLWSMVVTPRILRKGPPQIRRSFAEAVVPAATNFLRVAGITALASGLVLVGMLWGWSDYAKAFQVPGGYGAALGVGATSAILLAIVGFGFIAPLAHKMVATMQTINGPPTEAQQAQLAGIGKRMGMLSMAAVLLATITIFGMALAVNAVR